MKRREKRKKIITQSTVNMPSLPAFFFLNEIVQENYLMIVLDAPTKKGKSKVRNCDDRL